LASQTARKEGGRATHSAGEPRKKRGRSREGRNSYREKNRGAVDIPVRESFYVVPVLRGKGKDRNSSSLSGAPERVIKGPSLSFDVWGEDGEALEKITITRERKTHRSGIGWTEQERGVASAPYVSVRKGGPPDTR